MAETMTLARLEEFESLLRHPGRPEVHVHLRRQDGGVATAVSEDKAEFRVADGSPVLIDFSRSILASPENIRLPAVPRHAGVLRAVKSRMMNFLGTASQSRTRMARMAGLLAETGHSPLLLVVGGGTRGAGTEPLYEHPDIRVLAFDIYASTHTQLIADAHDIPLADACVDGVVIQAVLEHVLDPVRVISEIVRVLKPGGLVYAETPFMQQVHEGAYDFTRFTELGHRWLFRDFEAVDRGVNGGPGLSLYWSARYFFRALTRSRILAEMLSLPFMLACVADRFADSRHSIDGANGVYFFGRKQFGKQLAEAELPMEYRGAQ